MSKKRAEAVQALAQAMGELAATEEELRACEEEVDYLRSLCETQDKKVADLRKQLQQHE